MRGVAGWRQLGAADLRGNGVRARRVHAGSPLPGVTGRAVRPGEYLLCVLAGCVARR